MDAYDPDGNCMRLFLSTKPCTYQSVPTKVTSTLSSTSSLLLRTDSNLFSDHICSTIHDFHQQDR